jgi:glycogen(starch) synthase
MNVALFASAFYPHFGGVEEHVRQLAHAYQRMGLSPIVLTNRWPRSLPVEEEYEGIRVYRLPFRVPEGSVKARLNYHLTHAPIAREMLHILKSANIGLLHVHCVSSNGHYALIAKNALQLPLVVTTHGERTMDADHIYEKSRFLNKTLCRLLTEAGHVTACSQNTLDDIETYFGQSLGARAGVVYNGINLADFALGEAYSHPKPYILGIGRQVPQKGFDVLIQAFAQANLDTHDLLLAGDGSERPALEGLVQKLGLQNNVKFLGRTDRQTTVSLFHGCDFFVLPSRQEPFGIVNLVSAASQRLCRIKRQVCSCRAKTFLPWPNPSLVS